MNKRSRYGKERDQETWNSAEVDTIYKLFRAGVRVPKPYDFVDGVLVMECISGADGGPAPRIADCDFDDDEARVVFDQIITQVVGMLCADIVHADLSIFNILMADVPVIIDFPQSIGASSNMHARKILLRDVANITSCFRLGRPNEELRHGYEMWDLFEAGELTPDTVLTGQFELDQADIDEEALILEMREIEEDEAVSDYDD